MENFYKENKILTVMISIITVMLILWVLYFVAGLKYLLFIISVFFILFHFRKFLIANLLTIAVFYALFITGYTVFRSDQTQYLLLPFSKIFPSFCIRDWFVWGTSHYHYFYSFLVEGLYFLTFRKLEVGMFITWFLFLAGFIHSLYYLTKSSGGDYKIFRAHQNIQVS